MPFLKNLESFNYILPSWMGNRNSIFLFFERELMRDKKIYPVRYKSYTLKEMYNDLYLRDSPSLTFTYEKIGGCIQDSHLTTDEMLNVPMMAQSRWIYIRETFEWIPIFKFDVNVNQPPITELVDIELYRDKYNLEGGRDFWWATPKGFPLDQHE